MHYKCTKPTIRVALSRRCSEKPKQSTQKKKVLAQEWHPKQPQPDPVVTYIMTTNLRFRPDYFKLSFKELMERWGDFFFCFVSLSLCSSAVGSFGVKQLDKAAGRCFAAPEHFHRDTEITGAKKAGVHNHRHRVAFYVLCSCCSASGTGVKGCLV